MPTIRPLRDEDWPALTEIYNHYVVETPITFDVEPSSVEQRRERYARISLNGPHRMFVAEQEGRVIGYAASDAYRPKAAYQTSVETSIYLDPACTARGVGSLLYAALFRAIRGEDLRRALAGITVPNPASVALHRRFGFERVGVFHEVGRKLGRYWDVEWFEKRLDE